MSIVSNPNWMRERVVHWALKFIGEESLDFSLDDEVTEFDNDNNA